jgi:hypothetical protein
MRIVAIVAVIVGTLFVLYRSFYPAYTYRFRLVVEVQVGDQIRAGSSVIEVTVSKQPRVLPDFLDVIQSARGEAVYVDLGDRRNVVALLASGEFAEDIGYINGLVPWHIKPKEFVDVGWSALPRLRGSWELTGSNMPTIVTFSDPTDPKSIRVIKPNDFEEVFGPEIHWRGARVEMTDAPVSSGIVNRLPWLKGMASWLGDSTITKAGQFTLNRSYFIR